MMYSLTSLLLAGGLAFQTVFALPGSNYINQRDADILKRSVDSFIATESPIALSRILCNIGSDGACVQGAKSGIVIAAPGKVSPDCKYSFGTLRHGLHTDFYQRLLHMDT